MVKHFYIIFIALLISVTGSSQIIGPGQLEQLGFDEAVIQQRLLEKGFDINQIQPNQIGDLQRVLQEVILELELERSLATDSIENELITEDSSTLVQTPQANIRDSFPKNTIDTFAIDSIQNAAIFGQHIFRDKSLGVYDRSTNRKAPETYVLGPGDEISVSFWGESQRSFSFTINADGYIKPDKLSRIYLTGLSLKQARALLLRSFQSVYLFKPDEFETSISYARDITINIVGEVNNYGSFTLPAINTAFNALIAAGGPTDIGSVRNIRLIRSGERSRRIDVYEFLFNPDSSQDFYLQENDFIHVEVADRVVTIEGAIQRPFRYELIDGENLKDLIEYAGGLKNNAYQENIQLKRLQNNRYVLLDINYAALLNSNKDFELQNGDIVEITETPEELKQFVEVAGAVRFPGDYAYSDNIRVSDLIQKSILEEKARLDIAFLIQVAADSSISYKKISLLEALENPGTTVDPILKPLDNLLVLSQIDFTDQGYVHVRGAVRIPSKYAYSADGLKVADVLLLAGGLRPDATSFAYIHRADPNSERPIEYIRVDLQKAAEQGNTVDNLALLPADTLVVFSKLDFQDEQTVAVRGAVRNPSNFKYDKSLNLKDVLIMSGGIRPEAAKNRIDIFRLDYKDQEVTKTIYRTLEVDENLNLVGGGTFPLLPSDQIVVRQAPEYNEQQNITILGEVKYPGIYAMTDKNERLLSLIKRAGGFTEAAFPEGASLYRTDKGKGYIILDLDKAIKQTNSDYNLILKNGDMLEVPGKEDLVTIQTKGTQANLLYPAKVSIQGKFNVTYQKGKNAKWYIDNHAAGLSKRAKRKWVTVEHANGNIERTKGFLFFRRYPDVHKGSSISVGVKEKKKRKNADDTNRKDWKRILADTVTQATAIITLILLIDRL